MRWITLGAPAFCIPFALLGTFLQVQHLRQIRLQQELTQKQLTDLNQMLTAVSQQPSLTKFPTAPNTPEEQGAFLTMLRAAAEAHGAQLVHFELKSTPSEFTNATTVNGTAAATVKKMPDGVIPIFNDVELAGNYPAVREVLYDLLRAPRLYNTTDLKWTTDDKYITRLRFTLIRYVAVPSAPPAPGNASASAGPAS